MSLTTLVAAAVDIDGVVVADTFSPVIKSLVEAYGGTYDRDIERHVFSQNRHLAAQYLLDRLGLDRSTDEFLAEYFRARDAWVATHGGGLVPGAEGFLTTLSDAGLRLICYGGLSESHFLRELGPLARRFEGYVCTNDFRPGVAEIVARLGLEPRQVVFFDDVSRVAEAARPLGCPFVGVPASWPWGHQRRDMEALGVPVILDSLDAVTPGFLATLDDRATRGYWEGP